MKNAEVVGKLLSGAMALAVLCCCLGTWEAQAQDETTLTAGNFGMVHIYRRTAQPRNVVLFISGDGGWNLGVIDMAREIAGLDALVAGIDIVHYLGRSGRAGRECFYPAADFEALSKTIQKTFAYSSYVRPILVGYSSGATLVYALMAQAPPGTFKGGLSLGFCPDLPLPRTPCRGSGLSWQAVPGKKTYVFSPDSRLETPWILLQGMIDQVCAPQPAQAFAAGTAGARVILLPKVGHGFSVPRNWLPQFKDAFARLAATPGPQAGEGIEGLPLVEVPARADALPQLAVMVSGDGGWAGIDRQLAGELAGRGMPVVGLNSLSYFWTGRTPDGAAADLQRILRHYLESWHKEKAVLIGYSLGADVLPFMISRLPPDLTARISLVALLGPSLETAFEFHLSDWFGVGGRGRQYPVLPEVAKMEGLRIMCFYGRQESDSLCRKALPASVVPVQMGGGHHFDGNYRAIADAVLRAVAGK